MFHCLEQKNFFFENELFPRQSEGGDNISQSGGDFPTGTHSGAVMKITIPLFIPSY